MAPRKETGAAAATGEADAGRQRRMGVLAQADFERLSALWSAAGLDPEVEILRGPESGMVALRGQIGGTGKPFQVGEISATRVTVRTPAGVGHAMVAGRNQAHAKLAAVIDALCCDPGFARGLEEAILTPLERATAAADDQRARETAATRVSFFTMVRGE